MVTEDFFLINLKNYKTKNFSNGSASIWNRVPVARRSLVFILLFLGSMGELRVVLTKRSSTLRNFPGHISFPGGKADSGLEDEWQVSRREMEEEIGLSSNNEVLCKEYGFQIDHINTLPCYLSRTFSAVKPCIGFMNFTKRSMNSRDSDHLEEVLHKRIQMNLNPGESSSIFSCPLKDFLYPAGGKSADSAVEAIDRLSLKVKWGKIPWNLRSYTFPQNNPHEVDWLREIKDLSELDMESPEEVEAEEEEDRKKLQRELKESKQNKLSEWGRLGSRRDSLTNEKIYDVWGLTANILHDLAELTYNTTPEENGKEISRELGEEELIYLLWHFGNQLQARERSEEELKLISSTSARDELGFDDVLPRTEFNRLKSLYKV